MTGQSVETWVTVLLTKGAMLGSRCKLHLYKCRTSAGLGTFSWGWGLPTLGCLCKTLPNIETVPRPTDVWQKDIFGTYSAL